MRLTRIKQWIFVDFVEEMRVVGCNWVYTVKCDLDGIIL